MPPPLQSMAQSCPSEEREKGCGWGAGGRHMTGRRGCFLAEGTRQRLWGPRLEGVLFSPLSPSGSCVSPPCELSQRQRWRNFQRMGWNAYGISPAHKYDLKLNFFLSFLMFRTPPPTHPFFFLFFFLFFFTETSH